MEPLHIDLEDPTREWVETDWQEVLTKGYPQLVGLCKVYARGAWEECMSDVVVHNLPGILRNYDSSRGVPLWGKVYTDLRWYIFKWLERKDKYGTLKVGSLDNAIAEGEVEEPYWEDDDRVDNIQAVTLAMQSLDEYDRMLLMFKFYEGLSVRQLADRLSLSVGATHKHLQQALNRMEEALDYDG